MKSTKSLAHQLVNKLLEVSDWNSGTLTIPAHQLKRGHVVVNPDSGQRRTCTSDAQLTGRGYVRAETDGEPVNIHRDDTVHILRRPNGQPVDNSPEDSAADDM